MLKSGRAGTTVGLRVFMVLALICVGAFVPGQVLAVGVAPNLGVAGDFAVLAYSTVTNTGSTIVTQGDVGVYPLTSITGFPPGLVLDGTIRIADGVAQQGQTDLAAAYVDLAGQAFDFDLTATPDMAGMILTPGVYHFDSVASIGGGGTLTLDANGDPAAVWIFQIGSTLITSSSSVVDVIDGGSDCNVYWQVGTSATIGSSTTFVGDILAMESITMNTSATTTGRLLARTGAVTLDGNTMTPCDALLEGTLSIFKFHDVDGNGVYLEGTDIPLADWVFAVEDSTDTPIAGSPFTTDAFGFIDIIGLTPGDYDVTETVKAGWTATTANPQTGTVVDGEVELLQFGNALEEGAVGIFKFHDWNDNGTYDPLGDTPLPGWQFAVEGAVGGTVAGSPFTTDASGFIVLTGLAADTYTVTETVQPDWELTTANDQQVIVAAGAPGGGMLYFGNMQLGQGILTIFKFDDVDGDGIYEPIDGETPLPGWDFDITGLSYDESRTTDGTGLIILTGLVPGDYTVTEVLEFGWTPTTDDSQDATVSNTSDERLDFGNQYTYVPPSSSTMPVGGEASPVDKVGLLMPWLIVLAVVAAVAMVAKRRLHSDR